jgi:hypothetical protein
MKRWNCLLGISSAKTLSDARLRFRGEGLASAPLVPAQDGPLTVADMLRAVLGALMRHGSAGRSHDFLWAAARHLPDRHAELSRFDLEQGRRSRRQFHSRRDTARLAQARVDVFERDLEGDRSLLPIGIVSTDAIALGEGPPARREHEIADLLSFLKHAGVGNVVWLTADMHYTSAHYYDPNHAVFQDFRGVLGVRFGATACCASG